MTKPIGCQVGVISDTHGLLRPEALCALEGSDFIVHAGDVGSAKILAQLEAIAPTTAVRGNMDKHDEPRVASLPPSAVVQAGAVAVYVLHDLNQLDLDPVSAGLAAVISGHTHRPNILRQDGVLYFNPGSAGPRRGSLPISVGRLRIAGTEITGTHTAIDD